MGYEDYLNHKDILEDTERMIQAVKFNYISTVVDVYCIANEELGFTLKLKSKGESERIRDWTENTKANPTLYFQDLVFTFDKLINNSDGRQGLAFQVVATLMHTLRAKDLYIIDLEEELELIKMEMDDLNSTDVSARMARKEIEERIENTLRTERKDMRRHVESMAREYSERQIKLDERQHALEGKALKLEETKTELADKLAKAAKHLEEAKKKRDERETPILANLATLDVTEQRDQLLLMVSNLQQQVNEQERALSQNETELREMGEAVKRLKRGNSSLTDERKMLLTYFNQLVDYSLEYTENVHSRYLMSTIRKDTDRFKRNMMGLERAIAEIASLDMILE